jgi:hypothetical protein
VVRTALRERRFDVRIARDGAEYRWSLHEVGGPYEDAGPDSVADPEDAFWEAWTSIEAAGA